MTRFDRTTQTDRPLTPAPDMHSRWWWEGQRVEVVGVTCEACPRVDPLLIGGTVAKGVKAEELE